jgi:hypothetical protein
MQSLWGRVVASSVLASGTLVAASLNAFNTADAFLCMSQTTGSCGISRQEQIVASGTAAINGSFGSMSVGSVATADISATSGYGVLRSRSSTTLDITGTPKYTAATADGVFEDIITINFAPLTGQTGELFISYNLDGTISSIGSADNAFAEVFIAVGSSLEQQQGALHPASTSGQFLVPRTFFFTYGTPFGIYFDLFAGTGTITPLSGGNGYGQLTGLGNASASANFSNTLILSGLMVTDNAGRLVNGATFTSASGTTYSVNGVIPEPGTVALTSAGIVVMLVFAALRQKFIALSKSAFQGSVRV